MQNLPQSIKIFKSNFISISFAPTNSYSDMSFQKEVSALLFAWKFLHISKVRASAGIEILAIASAVFGKM